MDSVLDRLKVLLDSSTPIVVMETVEEARAVRLGRAACASLNLAAFEWTIASGLVRCGAAGTDSGQLPPGGYQAGESWAAADNAKALYDRRGILACVLTTPAGLIAGPAPPAATPPSPPHSSGPRTVGIPRRPFPASRAPDA